MSHEMYGNLWNNWYLIFNLKFKMYGNNLNNWINSKMYGNNLKNLNYIYKLLEII